MQRKPHNRNYNFDNFPRGSVGLSDLGEVKVRVCGLLIVAAVVLLCSLRFQLEKFYPPAGEKGLASLQALSGRRGRDSGPSKFEA